VLIRQHCAKAVNRSLMEHWYHFTVLLRCQETTVLTH